MQLHNCDRRMDHLWNEGATMKMQNLLAVAVTVLLMSAGSASAIPVTYTIEGTITVTTCTSSTPCTSISNFTGTAPSIVDVLNISSGLPTGPQTLYQADPANANVSGTIQVLFQFTEINNATGKTVGTGSLTEDAKFQANYNGPGPNGSGTLSCSTSSGPSDCIYWAGNGSSPTDDGSTYTGSGEGDHVSTTASVPNVLVTLSDGASFHVNFFDAQDWDITPGVSFTNIDPTPTPLPAALPLFAGGLSVIGLFGWRRKRKAAAMAA